MNTDERERLKQIRERHRRGYNYGPENEQMEGDIDFLLAQLDSQAKSIELLQKIPVVANEALDMTLGQIQESVATRMRDLCVGEITEMQAMIRKRNRDRDEANRPDAYRINILEQAVERLQSLTLDQVEEKQ